MTTTATRLEAKSLIPGFTVNDLERSIGFYEGLGFTVDQRWEEAGELRGVMLKAGAAELGLSRDDWAKGRDRVKGVAMRLWLQTDQDVDELAARVRGAGIELDQEPHDTPWGARAFDVTDPDGFALTVSKGM